MKCKNCGFEGKGDFEFCPKCGTKFETLKKKVAAKSEKTSAKVAKDVTGAKFNPQWLFLLAAVAVVAVLAFFIFSNQGTNNQLLLTLPRTSTKSDLMLIKAGDPMDKGERILKGFTASTKSTIANFDKYPLGTTILSSSATFSADGRSVFAAYQIDDDFYLDKFDVRSKEGINLYESGYTINSLVFPKAENVLIRETRSTTSCELLGSVKGEEAKRLLKGRNCSLSADGSTLLIREDEAAAVTTLSVAKAADPDNLIEILSEEKDILSYNLSSDGTLLYVSRGILNGAKKAVLYDTATGKKLVESDTFEYKYSTRFSTKGHGFYIITEAEDGTVDLSVLIGEGLVSIKTGKSINANFNDAGTYVAYAVSADGLSQTVYLYDLAAQTETEIVGGKSLSTAFIDKPERLLVKDNVVNEVTIYSTDMKGSSLEQIFNEPKYTVSTIYQPFDQNRLFILTGKDTNYHLFVTSLDKEDGFFLIEDFKRISPLALSKDGGILVFTGDETSSTEKQLFRINIEEDADMEEIDDDGTTYANAVFTPDGKTLFYTVKTGTDRSDYVVRSVELKEKSKPVDLYEEATIQDVSWGRLYPWQLVSWSATTISGMTSCADAKELPIANGQVKSEITGGKEDCYKISLKANEQLAFTVVNTTGTASTMTIIDRAGKSYATGRVAVNKTTNEAVTSIVYTPTATGLYYLKNSSTKSMSYTLYVNVKKNSFTANAPTILSGQTLSGMLDKNDYFIDRNYLSAYVQGYGEAYAVSGKTGQRLEVNLVGETADANLKPTLMLFNSTKKQVAAGTFQDDKTGALAYTLPSTGKYYVLFLSANRDYGLGLEKSFEYRILVSLKDPGEAESD